MDHDDEESAAKDVASQDIPVIPPLDPPPDEEPTMTNELKRRNSSEEDVEGEKRLREGEEQPVIESHNTSTPPDLDIDPQMQVSSLDSEYNEPATSGVDENGSTMEAVPFQEPNNQDNVVDNGGEAEEEPPQVEEGAVGGLTDDTLSQQTTLTEPSTDFDVSAKLREMGEISVEPVSKTEATKRTNEEEEAVDEVSLTKKLKDEETDEKKKVTNLRKNIREVIDDTMLDASTLAAQREEQERLNRVQEQQRALRAQQRQTDLDKRQSSILSLLQGTLDTNEDPLSGPAVSISAVRVLDKKTGQVLEEIPDQQSILEPGEIPNPALAHAQLVEAQKLTDRVEKKEVVTIDDSSDDDCIMLSDEEEEPDGDDDPHNSGLHVNDTYNLPDDEGRVLVNFGHSETEPDVFVAPQIARALKPHQIGGIRFLYDNIIESLDRFDSSTGFGCILAHSMGLGKTLQLVCFCDIILRHTSAKTVLCIMPINTLQNWLAEFNWWLPENVDKSPLKEFGEVRGRNFKIHVLNDSQKTIAARSKVVLNWTRTGGVLLIGYELYRLLCLKKVVKKKGKRAVRDPVYAEKEQAAHGELLEEIYEALVKPGPDLVVCDEGHRIKSSHASTSVALKQIRTKRRVVLTGYPLQNNLLEYWCMVDFVRPNYLGTKTEFCNMFEKPIQNGQCIDSTPQDIKLMRYRAHVLHSLLLGFVQRRSHLVLQSTLPNKLEYVMLVRMTPFQRKLYDVFMNEVVRKKAVPNPLKAFAVCCKIWNHPDVLYNFLKKREADLDLELEEELAMAEAKKLRKEKEKKVKEEKAKEEAAKAAEEAVKAAALAEATKSLENGLKVKEEGEIVPKLETNMNYQNAGGMNPYGQNAYGGYNSITTDPMSGVGGAYDPYGIGGAGTVNSNYYSQYNNHHNSYQQSVTGGGGVVGMGSGYDANQQYYSNDHHNQQQQDGMKAKTGGYWGENGGGDQFGGNSTQSSNSSGYYDQSINQVASSVQYSQGYGMSSGQGPVTGNENIPTTITETKTEVTKVEEAKVKEDAGEEEKEEGEVSRCSTPEKEIKSSRDDGIPYDWAVELMKDYVPDLLENAPKMEIFFCILNESLAVGDRILVFSQSLLTLNLIERYLQKNKVHGKDVFWAKNTNYFRLDGSTTACDRERLINEFNTNEDVAIFLVSTRAGSLGINLVGANRVIVFDASWNPCHDTQAVCRVYRYGQKKQCYVYRMVMDNCLEKRIYDRQVNKQGMSDRVVDECNPDAHLSIKEVTNLCWDNDEETEVKDFSDMKDQYPDEVMKKVLEKFSASLSKEPFRHESLLVDRKEKKLSMAEKRLAQRGYELEKQASTKTAYNYTGKVTQYRVFRTADGSLVHRAVGTVAPLGGSGTTPSAPGTGSKWIPAEVWRQQGMTTQETTLPADVTIPSNSGDKSGGIVLKAGQKVMILKSTKGVYMQLETGKIIAIRTGPKAQPGSQTAMNIPRPRGFGDVNEVIKLDDDDDDDDEEEEGEVVPADKPKVKKEVAVSSAIKSESSKKVVKESESKSSGTTSEVKTGGSSAVGNHQMATTPNQSSSSSYYANNHSGYPASGYNASNYRQYDAPASATKSHSSRDYNSYQPTATGYSDTRSAGGGDYQQKAYNQVAGHELSGQSVPTGGSASSSQVLSAHSGQSGGYGNATSGAYGGHYGAASGETMPSSNGQFGGQQIHSAGSAATQQQQHVSSQQQHRSTAVPSVAAAAAPLPPPPSYPQTGYDYANTRYYDTQPKSYNHNPAGHYSTPSSAYPQAAAYANAYHHPHHQHHPHQYGQHRAGEYNPNNPPYYMNPFAGAAAAGAAGGVNPYQQAQATYDQTAAAHLQQGQQSQQQLPQHHQPYADGSSVYGGAYGGQYNGPTTATAGVAGGQQVGKVEAPVAEKRKESSSRRRNSDSAFHKPTTTESPDVVPKVATAEKKEATSNYYDRASSNYGAFATPYSPFNYPPSPYFYPSSYCPPPPPPSSSSSSRESKSSASSSASSSKYYDRTPSQFYQPP